MAHEQIQKYYDEFADVYDTKHGVILAGQSYNFDTYYQPFLRKVLPKSGTVLELGCGTGVYTQWLSEHGLKVVGMDISAEMIKQAKKRSPQTSFYQGDCENPAEFIKDRDTKGAFDVLAGINTFSYYMHKENALLNYKKILKPGGRLVVIDMNGACPYYQWMSWMNKNEMREWLPQIKESNQRTLESLFQKTGFRFEHLEFFAFIPNGLGPAPVSILIPFDKFLNAFSFLRPLAMRIAYSAVSV